MNTTSLTDLLGEYATAQSYSLGLIGGLTPEQICWRPDQNSSAIGWHLGHQAAVNHYMVRNLTAAEVTKNAAFDALFDSATPEPARNDLPSIDEIVDYRDSIAQSTRSVIERIARGDVGAPEQLALIGSAMLQAIVNHEYQHAKWIGEVRSTMIDDPAPTPSSSRLVDVDGYYMLDNSQSVPSV